MAIHINSEQLSSGSRENGVWNLNGSIQGSYKILDQHMDTTAIPWINSNLNTLSFEVGASLILEFHLFKDLLDGQDDLTIYKYEDDLETIRNYLEDRFNEFGATLGGDSFSVVITLQDNNKTLKMLFDTSMSLHWNSSNCAPLFDKTGTETGATFYLTTKNIDINPTLYVYISESNSKYIEADDNRPTLLFRNEHDAILNQQVIFRNLVNQFTITIYRQNLPDVFIGLLNQWDLILIPGI